MSTLTKTQNIASWICRIIAAVILLQTLFFKFTAAPESVYIFTKVGLEPWGRIGSGVIEAGCRTVVGLRLKQPGMFWSAHGAHAILQVRCAHLSNRFSDFWDARSAA